MQALNLFDLSTARASAEAESLQDILRSPHLRIERIVSLGHTSPEQGWYDQTENEWVLVLEGRGELTFDDGRTVALGKGDHIHIPAHCKHRVSWTDPAQATVWLAVFYP
ncbi:cupin domain-containing protein [Variovorax sp. HJSM1_2]|uniref:cupin domain-containing protein n=1 Tax=Variovorax sp. HJSM1_2 TaxID=3366263 RepID=UPI003BDD06B0